MTHIIFDLCTAVIYEYDYEALSLFSRKVLGVYLFNLGKGEWSLRIRSYPTHFCFSFFKRLLRIVTFVDKT
jgi:hypothetical protein